MDFTIQKVLILTDTGYRTVDIRIEGDAIAHIAPDLEARGTIVNGANKLLLPGFINAHTHSSEMWQRGLISPYPLELWLTQLYDCPVINLEQIYLSALGTAAETLLSGGTCVVDHLVLIPGKELETVEATIRGYREIGIRAFIGPLIYDRALDAGIPDEGANREIEPFYWTAEQNLNFLQAAIEKFHRPEEGIGIMTAPTGMQLCSDALFKGCIELSDRYNLCRHTHLLETKAQEKLAWEKYGCTAVAYLDRIGFLSDRTSLAHCVWLNDEDISLLAKTRSTVVHNPLSNLRLGSGIAPVLKYRQAGVNVAFGCDGTASSDGQDMLEAIKIGTMLHNTTDFEYRNWIDPKKAVKMAALGGATGIKLADKIGSLEVGKKADLVLYDLTNLSLLPRTDPVGLLIFGRPTRVVDSVWVNGDRIVAEGKPTRIDIEKLRQDLFQYSDWTGDTKSSTTQKMEAHYRHVMGLPGS
ncbi:MAG: amidohydrolase [Cyanobacteria bacterium SBLK]|nr:amidohydrolase [Cyanobacteria bacterium SBLK]